MRPTWECSVNWCDFNSLVRNRLWFVLTVFVWYLAFALGKELTHVSPGGLPMTFLLWKRIYPDSFPSFYEIRAACSDNRPAGWKVQWGSPKSWGFSQKWGELFTSGEIYPLVICQIAIENDHWNSGFSHWKSWFPIAMLVYQRVYVEMKNMFFSPHLFHLETFNFFFFFFS